MTDHEGALQGALITALRADAGVSALLAGRVWDQPPMEAGLPHLLLRGGTSWPVAADGCGIEHALTLAVVSDFPGAEEARAVCAAVRTALDGATLESGGMRTVSVRVTRVEVSRAADGRRTLGVVRLRAVTEEI